MKTETRPDGYFKGDAYRLTGKTISLYGGTWKEAIMLEGLDAGKNKLIKSVDKRV